MTKKLILTRPATCAIAAFLALSSPSAFAQETAAPVPAPVAPTIMVPPVAPTTVPAPTTSAPVATTAQPTPVIRVPLNIEPAPAPVAEAAPRPAARAAARPAAAERTVARTAAPAAAVAAPTVAPDASEFIPTESSATALPEQSIAPIAPIAEPAPTQVVDSAASNESFPWEIAGGAAALLLVGGAGLAFARRRRNSARAEEPFEYDSVVPAAAPVVTREPAAPVSQPVVAPPAYAAREQQLSATPPTTPRSTPAFAAAPSGSMGRNEALAMAGPSAENPFLTLKQRLKRARFYDRQDRMNYESTLTRDPVVAHQPATAWEIANRPAPAATGQQQTARRPDQRGLFSGGLRPGFANS